MRRCMRRLAWGFGSILLAGAILVAPVQAQNTKQTSPNPTKVATPRPAQELVDAAVATAVAQHKNVLVHFGASWCGWCHRFEAFLDDPVVGKLMHDNFVMVGLTVSERGDKTVLNNPGSDVLMKAMGGAGGLPFFFFLDSTGKKIGDANIMPGQSNVGHPSLPAEVDAFTELLKTVAPGMTAAQRAQIHDYLTRIANGA